MTLSDGPTFGYGLLIGLVFGILLAGLAATIPARRAKARRNAAAASSSQLLDHFERAVYAEVRHAFGNPAPNDAEALRLAGDVRAARYSILTSLDR